ncbi:biopolymer transporter ExbD [Epibacterium sp. SM1969]|uniref:Biopolymer transporter ExbD n=1 Tax=Tritonibacter aquimaris TaxID=2663379 RepID=A0A844AXW9_9RHOB|nr:biopolymer transporter ExbD [Tritonibacter aquimaris]MQY44428.1 biopolymer transporter ExbD [Tritonibacter aquimaris]
MDFSTPPKPARTESIVPMINVVFLLLIFFLMTSHLAQPEPFEVTPPEAVSERETESDPVLYVGKEAELAFEDSQGDAAIAALRGAVEDGAVVQVRADGELKAQSMAKLLRQLSEAGLSRVELVVAPK